MQGRKPGIALIRLYIQIHIPATPRIIHARAKQPNLGIRAKALARCLQYALLLYSAEPHQSAAGKARLR